MRSNCQCTLALLCMMSLTMFTICSGFVYDINVFAGVGLNNAQGTMSDGSGGPAISAYLAKPRSLWQDTAGTYYESEAQVNYIRKISGINNIISNFAGIYSTSGSYSGDNGPALNARLNFPVSIVTDTVGNFYFADFGNNRIRKVASDSIITTVCGTGTQTSTNDYHKATAATVAGPHGLWMNTAGVMFISEFHGYRLRVVDTAQIITTLTGQGRSAFYGEGIKATSADISKSERVTGDTMGNIFLSDSGNNRVRMISASTQIITTVAGTGSMTYNGDNIKATSAGINFSRGLYIDPHSGDFTVCEKNHRIRQVSSSTGIIKTVAGTGVNGNSGDGGKATSATFNEPDGLFGDTTDVIYVADWEGFKIRALSDRNPTATPTVIPTVIPIVIPTAAPTYTPLDGFVLKSPTYKVTNGYAFAAINSTGGVLTWGSAPDGGDSSAVAHLLVNITSIVASKNAFAALCDDGSVVAWGLSDQIERWESVSGKVVSLVATELAFAGLTDTRAVVTFGAACCGGSANEDGFSSADLSSNILFIAATAGAVAAVRIDGMIYSWGSAYAGGGGVTFKNEDIFKYVVQLTTSHSTFCALYSDGSAVTWGGGSNNPVSVVGVDGVSQVIANGGAFVGFQSTTGALALWGLSHAGGDADAVNEELRSDVVSVAQTTTAFAALKKDGTAVVWGDASAGGDMSIASSNMTDIVAVQGNHAAFAALTIVGSVTVWGDAQSGGSMLVSSMRNVTELLSSGVVSIHHTDRAFAALKTDGSVVVWGRAHYGGSVSADVASQLSSDVRLICANDLAFTAIKTDGSVIMWGNKLGATEQGLQLGLNFSSVNEC